jgi:hypothetical protein
VTPRLRLSRELRCCTNATLLVAAMQRERL